MTGPVRIDLTEHRSHPRQASDPDAIRAHAAAFQGWLTDHGYSDSEAAQRLRVTRDFVAQLARGNIDAARLGPSLAVRLLQVTGLPAHALGLAPVPDEIDPPADASGSNPIPVQADRPVAGTGGGAGGDPLPPPEWRFHICPGGGRVAAGVGAIVAGDACVIEHRLTASQAIAIGEQLIRFGRLAAAPGSVPA